MTLCSATSSTHISSHYFPEENRRAFTNVNVCPNDSAPFFSRFFMMLREMPSYLSTAKDLRFKYKTDGKNIFQQYWTVIKEIIFYRLDYKDFYTNIEKLDNDFLEKNNAIGNNGKPLCAYFVSSYDQNGAILGNRLYYYHHYKIKNFEKHYAVAAKVVRTTGEMFQFLNQIKKSYPNREIKVIDIVSHGSKNTLCVKKENGNFYTCSDVQENEFHDCAKDATIILDACSVGKGSQSIAEKIAKMNPGKTIIAPGVNLYFSKPIITKNHGHPTIDHVVHGFALVNAFTAKKFKYLAH
jgi:hypothetical protein